MNARFDRAKAEARVAKVMERIMDTLAEKCRTFAVESMAVYKSGENMGRYTRASAPGESPAIQTGALSRSIDWKADGDDRLVGTNIKALGGYPYGYYLEYGSPGGKIKPRPFMRPALARTHANMPAILNKFKGKL